MPHTYVQNAIHVIFSTKDRMKIIPMDFQVVMWKYITGICKNHEMFVHAVGGTEDHVHLLIQIPASMALSKAVNTIKSNSSKWANEEGRTFAWQEGYAAFSVSASNIPAVVQYIETQGEHHKRMDFEAEMVALLKKHGVEFDPKYVFG